MSIKEDVNFMHYSMYTRKMVLFLKRICLMSLAAIFLLVAESFGQTNEGLPDTQKSPGHICIDCHQRINPSMVQKWKNGRHYNAAVRCLECHGVEKGEPGAVSHYRQMVSTIVSPKKCAGCHKPEVEEFSKSRHANAVCRVTKVDEVTLCYKYVLNLSGKDEFKTPGFPGGVSAAGINTYWKCHGYEVKLDADGKLDPATWPDTGIGRINPDGSKGNCEACHMAHEFSRAQARRPESCSICHAGGDGCFGYEIFAGSRHGIFYSANIDKMALDEFNWVLDETYSAAPTCATCHMSGTRKIRKTHDVSARRLMSRRDLKVMAQRGWGRMQ